MTEYNNVDIGVGYSFVTFKINLKMGKISKVKKNMQKAQITQMCIKTGRSIGNNVLTQHLK
ncbi:hypothetical protein JFL43_09070 [Viridibacillus sp. YIM B01967]|uniref:Transposase n=1 Tax=Viridibacillus soli TaxID=2798301 RepID=A0ABS1H6G9_9BACL|nr:hypothetical protein [Viridibacillus soli]MBK3495008.1 hypothetical protein [Viridibacillus soli]